LAKDAATFRSLFNSFLSAARAITGALQKDGAKLPAFTEWYRKKQGEMKADELLRFIHEARVEDFHEGRHRLSFSTYIGYLSSEEVGPPPTPGASLVIGPDGPFWLVDEGTARERRIPVGGGSFITRIAIANPPTTHMGKRLQRTDPLSILTAALTYFENLVHEAKSGFATS